MKKGKIKIINERGMHARAASKFVHKANQFSSKIKIIKGTIEVDGKSILGILLLQASKGTELTFEITGPDEEEAFAGLEEMINDRFGEKN